jgi:alpha-L-rhamnosidase
MRKIILSVLLATSLISCINNKRSNDNDHAFANSKWIAFEQLDDSMKVVPAVHGSGENLGQKCVKRSKIPMFRKEFYETGNIESASINICGLGHYELYINGQKIGDRFLSPGWTYYQKRIFYNTYDITEFINKGDNVLGVIVGNGFYNINRERYRKLVVAYGYPRLLFNVSLKMKDGTIRHIVSDENCKVTNSPLTFTSIYGGEDYDARLEQEGWNKPGFDDTKWMNPKLLNDTLPAPELEKDFPVRVLQTFETQKISGSKTGRTIYDFGQNASGIIALKVSGNRGAQIIIRPDELLNSEGNITQISGGGPYELNYTLKGGNVETWQPTFTYYGFRYADVEIIEPDEKDKKTKILSLTMLHTRNSSPSVGSFSCSDTLFNQIFELINWGIRSNMASVATDCPHREKLGWLEETYLLGSSMHYNYDIHAFYNKIVNDMMDSQLDNGLVPDIAPEYVPFNGGFRDSPEWGSASVIIPWLLYKWYGDTDVLQRSYPMGKGYLSYLHSKALDNIIDYGLGDWYDLGTDHPGEAQLTPKALTATSVYYYDLQIMAQIAELLGYYDDNKKYKDLSEKVKNSFLKKFYNSETGVCATGSQTSYSLALYTGLIPEKDKSKVFSNLINSITENNYELTSGDIGYHFLVRVLSENGRSDILYKMNNRTDVPGYGYQLKMGATALTESWAALATSSNNHMMLGHLMEWFYSGLGGIYQSETSVAYSNIVIAPKPVGNIKWVKCSYKSIKGVISSEWEIKGEDFILNIEVPKNANAKIVLPDNYINTYYTVKDINNNSEVKVKITEGEFEIEEGKYEVFAKRKV